MGDENSAAAFAVLAHKVDAMHSDVSEMRAALRDLTSAISKLALFEERQSHFSMAQERLFNLLEKQDAHVEELAKRLHELEVSEPEQKRTSGWIMAIVWSAAGLAAVLILGKFGLKV